MCGIAGIIYRDTGRDCEELLTRMRDTMVHRGPDAHGAYAERNVGIGHRRLSIIDLSGGQQPMTNEDESAWIVFNGEIYNFRELRARLEARGHVFKTSSDTEVILHLYEEEGEECVHSLNGMFAFAIWDKKERKLFLARDRVGVKPVYYAETPEGIVFASEIKALLESGLVKTGCDRDSVFEYFVFRHISGDKTMFRGIRSLMPGHRLSYKDGRASVSQYWSPFPRKMENISFSDTVEKVSALLHDSVKIRLVSEVPLGTFCSGGIDSSLITGIASKYASGTLNTFSVGFHESAYDETSYARTVAGKFKTSHHELRLNNSEFASLLPKLIWYNDEPLNFPNSVHMYAICRLAKEFVTVVLTGEGSDELFAGYPRYLIPRLMDYYRRMPMSARRVLQAGASLFRDHRIEKLRGFASVSLEDIILYNSSFLNRDFLSGVLPDYGPADFTFRRETIARGQALGLDPVSTLSLLDQQNYLISILNRQDKMSMAASIESRVPFLDYRLVELANGLPVKHKIDLFNRKKVIKSVAKGILPDEVINRKKSGFGVPLDLWLRSGEGMGQLAGALGSSQRLESYMNMERLKSILSEHASGAKDHTDFLWAAINFDLWLETFGL